jgi:hypothetical protein
MAKPSTAGDAARRTAAALARRRPDLVWAMPAAPSAAHVTGAG